MRPIKKIILHCTDNPNPAWTAADCRAFHISKGWLDIGYHYFIRSSGLIEVGRKESEVGAHCFGHNLDSIGVALNGRDTFTQTQREALWQLLERLSDKYPDATLHGHREFNPGKTCPNFDYSEELLRWALLGERARKDKWS